MNGQPFLYLWYMAQQEGVLFLPVEPSLLPPDLFAIAPEAKLRVTVAYNEDRYELVYDDAGQLALFPMYWDGRYIPVRIQRKTAEHIINIEIPDKNLRFMVLEHEDGRPLRFQYEQDGERGFGVIHAWGNYIDESWYSETGELKSLYHYTWLSNGLVRLEILASDGTTTPLIQWDYNAQNRISLVVHEKTRTEYYYDGKGRIIRVTGCTLLPPDSQDATASRAGVEGPGYDCHYQYDEAGFLVRQYGRTEEGPFEYRYQYTLDPRGFWIQCKVQAWSEQFGRLVPGTETRITRTILRRKQ
jgi:YD repeat-containing protein